MTSKMRKPPITKPKPQRLSSPRSQESQDYFRPFFIPHQPCTKKQQETASGPTQAGSSKGKFDKLIGRLSRKYSNSEPARPENEQAQLCKACGEIDFEAIIGHGDSATRSTSDTPEMIAPFCKPIEKILEKRAICNFCGLLYDSLCQEDNDPILHPVIQDELQPNLKESLGFPGQSSPDSQPDRPFKAWSESYWTLKRHGIGEGDWPFGVTKDQNEASQASVNAILKELSERTNIEDFDVVANHSSGFDHGVLADGMLGATALMTVSGQHLPPSTEKIGQLTSVHAAFSARHMKNKLTCWIIGVAQKGSSRITIRTFAHGRAPRAPLQPLAQFRLLLEYGAPKVEGGRLRYANRPGNSTDLQFFRRCLQHCQDHHGDECDKPPQLEQLLSSRQGSLRLIYIPEARLVEFKFTDANIEHLEYVALSYRWGGNRAAADAESQRLYRATYYALQHPNGIDFRRLPRTISDAITVASQFGIDYLWVDSLCVMQDGDGDYELVGMGRIYSQSLFTIVAGDGPHSDYGLRGIRPDQERAAICQNLVVGPIIDRKIRGYLPMSLDEEVGAWESRAWTLQERLLSRRMLVFSKGFAVWRCPVEVCREDVNAMESSKVDRLPFLRLVKYANNPHAQYLREDGSDRLFRPKAMQQYCDIVANYSTRSLTHSQDVLRALSGVQAVLQHDGFLGPFRWGLPIRFLDVALLWMPQGSLERRASSEFTREADRPPSWAWAGWKQASASGERQTKGPQVRYEQPYTVTTDQAGALLMQYGDATDEKLVSFLRFYALSQDHVLRELSAAGLRNGANRSANTAPVIPLGINLRDQHLIFQTRAIKLRLGNHVTRIQERYEIPGSTQRILRVRLIPTGLEMPEGSVLLSEERLLHLCTDNRSAEAVGSVLLNSQPRTDEVCAIALSETRFFGTEKRVDVVGYPLFNIMLVEKEAGVYTRMGLGRIFKYAFNKAEPVEETIVLG